MSVGGQPTDGAMLKGFSLLLLSMYNGEDDEEINNEQRGRSSHSDHYLKLGI